ncbi:hypothetical protein ASC66_01895 [Leifsonia sp. Root4]|uniref:hypothetical protein n=1 Tax=Leifsonia sp. Root4 TaxID=1736525 RepID=UPI0006FCB10C|nr:hypothetical protein [Leifsonia sp. Root4]KQW07757.1 hypothetical protein ASC66_01895 [Leifsonia sp. Root4]
MTGTTPASQPANNTPSSNPVLRRALVLGGVVALAIAVVGGLIGWIVDGGVGLISALIGTALAVIFMGVTAATILLANRFSGSDLFVGAFFGIVLGGWLLKFIVFLVVVIVLKDQSWINPVVLFLSLIAGVIGSLIVDVMVMLKSRMPYVSDVVLPNQSSDAPAAENKSDNN